MPLNASPFLIHHFGNDRPPRATVLGVPQQLESPNRHGPTGAAVPAADEDIKLDAAERQRVIQAVIANLKEHYIDPAAAQKIEEALLAHEKAGDYDAMTDGSAFATLLTQQVREVSHDLQLDVVYSRRPLPERPPGPNPERAAAYRKLMEQQNCTFERVETLAHNIGYVKHLHQNFLVLKCGLLNTLLAGG
jgi:hypothetical protein